MKKIITILSITVFFVLITAVAGFSIDSNSARIIPSKTVTVFQEGKALSIFSKEAPLPLGAVLSCDGKCGIKMDDLLILGEDKSEFLIDAQSNHHIIDVRSGIVYFGLSGLSDSIYILTPKGAVSIDQVLLNASTENKLVEGYIQVGASSSEVGVLNGGSVLLDTADGHTLIKSGNRFTLAMADIGDEKKNNPDKDANVDPADKEGYWNNLSKGQKTAGLVIGGLAVGGATWAIINNNDNSNNDASPFEP
jgi:hypothetical protein